MVAELLLLVIGFFAVSVLAWGILNSIAHPKKNAGMLIFLLISGAVIYWLLTVDLI